MYQNKKKDVSYIETSSFFYQELSSSSH